MEKRSSKSPAIIEPNQLGCVWRFSGMFDHHQGNPNQKLLLDGSHVNKTLTGPGYTRSQVKLLSNFDKQCKGISIEPKKKTISLDGRERSVNKLMERERTSLKHVKQHKKARKDARIVVHQHPSCPMPMDISSHDEGFCYQIPRKNGRHSSLDKKTKQDQLDEKKLQLVQMSAETFIDQMFVDGKYLRRDRASHNSRQFSDALEILNSNKELFLKLLQDPNSLLVKHIQSLRDIQVETSKPLPEAKFSERESEKPVYSMEICKQTEEKSLWKRIKSQYEYPNKKNQNPHSLDKIVVLKPGQKTMQKPVNVGCYFSYLQSHHCLTSKEQIIKPTHFSFRDIRKKLKNARKLKNANSSTNSERGNKKNKPVDLKSRIRSEVGASASKKSNLSTVVYSKRQELDIFVEARRHLSERLRQVEKGEASSSKQASRTLERILLSPPKHDLLATLGPKREGTQMRFSPYGNSQVASEKSLQNLKEKKPVERLQILDSVGEAQGTDCFMTEDLSSSGYVEIMDTNDLLRTGDVYLSNMASEQNSINTTRRRVGNGCLEGSRGELPFENESLKFSSDASSPNTAHICKLEITDSDQDRGENPSPISVLESFFIDNISSPTSTIESAEPPIQPLHLDFEEQSQMVSPPYPKTGLHTCMGDKEFISAYINTVYQTSQSNWDEFLVKGCPRESCDHKLLYDCIKEVLIDLRQCYFGCSPWITFTKSQIQPVSLEKNVVDEVMEKVDWYNLPLTMPRTLDQIVGRDIRKSGKWVDIRVASEDIVIEVVEVALEELIMEAILDIQF